jgi:hypothetical protein
MLWTDRLFVTANDLISVDSEVPAFGQAERIVLGGPKGLISQVIQECGVELMSLMQSPGCVAAPTGVPAAHMQALLIGTAANTVRVQLGQVVVSDPRPNHWSPLQRWVIYKILARFYERIIQTQGADRIQAKWKNTMESLDLQYQPFLFNNGIPAVSNPLPCPGATGEVDTGSFTVDDVTVVDGGSSTDPQQLLVAVSWIGPEWVSPADRKNSESALSEGVQVNLQAGKGLTVSIANLLPPATMNLGLQYLGAYTPLIPVGWNLWVGPQRRGKMWLQQAAIPLDTKETTLLDIQIPGSYAEHTGQAATIAMSIQRIFQRG